VRKSDEAGVFGAEPWMGIKWRFFHGKNPETMKVRNMGKSGVYMGLPGLNT
jgi:hypothetical protein